MCVDLSQSLWIECISQTGILYFRLRFTRVLPSTYSLHILPHTLSFYVNLGPNLPPVPLAHSCITATEWKVESYLLTLSPNPSFSLHTAKVPCVHSRFLYLSSLDFVHATLPVTWIQPLPDDSILFSEHAT